jgi:hypothetical protein
MKPLFIIISAAVAGLAVATGFALYAQQSQTAPASGTASAPATTATQGRGPATAPPIRERPVAPPTAKSGTLTGRMLDAGGRGVAGAIIIYSSREPGGIGELPVPQVTTAPDGTFSIPQFPAGPRRATLTIMQVGKVIGTVQLDTNISPGAIYRLNEDIRLGGVIAVPVDAK